MTFANAQIPQFFGKSKTKAKNNANVNKQSHLVIGDEGPMSSDDPSFMLAQQEGNVHYTSRVIDDPNDELYGRLVMTESTNTDSAYRYVPYESVNAAAGPEVDDTVPLGDSDAVLAEHTPSCTASTASEPPDDTVPSTNGRSQAQQAESHSGNAAGTSAAADVTIPPGTSAVYRPKQFKDPPAYVKSIFGTEQKQFKL